jgi:hypothetical protein
MATTEEPHPEPGEPPDGSGPEEPDQPGSSRMETAQLVLDALGVLITLYGLLRGCGG